MAARAQQGGRAGGGGGARFAQFKLVLLGRLRDRDWVQHVLTGDR